ncbi:metalloregulator ArsR/SmtB family transcription factor [Chelatococcus sp. SYSU_G07232]|uniref:Metalloregulator ArsR/SmtB family transcription factor n=1 Tax=Chelatococcus albus TaxID=3047466 RepID=A0ABT7AH16_9HYPH|nr:metalloregulator ArsR/SmtB family transcription factor [Chelatococcus sp. SYSU_G07232]MDJ1158633.1 metalloregulator ArsR/SmtB family transcription factor [Chelatococcus sp. SYSU_G07232]
MADPVPLPMPVLLTALKAAGEETRLRILALLAEGELNVSDLTDILGQSQPRISRHLKLLAEAGLIERHREGAWAFFRLADRSPAAAATRSLIASLDARDEQLAADRARLAAVRKARAESAQSFFARLAADWDRVRSLHVSEEAVEAAIRDVVGDKPVRAFLDLGTGTGRMLQLLAPRAARAVGVDANHAMLSVARANLERAGLSSVELRQGDIYALPVERNAFDLVLVHQVLHYLDDPARAVREAAAVLAPGGRILIVDFAPHDLEFLRDQYAHRRLGFSREQLGAWLGEAGLDLVAHRELPPPERGENRLVVSLWLAQDRRIVTDLPVRSPHREVA